MPIENFASTFLLYRLSEWSMIYDLGALNRFANFSPLNIPYPPMRTAVTKALASSNMISIETKIIVMYFLIQTHAYK